MPPLCYTSPAMAKVAFLECSKCGARLSSDEPRTICPKDGGSLYVRYDLGALRGRFTPAMLAGRAASMWRYSEVLPDAEPVSLGEGFTPLLRSRQYSNVWIKDEGLNPTGTFKARGLCVAVTMARAYGLKKLAVPSAGNAASALAAYAAAAGIEAHIFMPRDVPAGEPGRVPQLWRAGHSGGRPHQRLRPHGRRAQRARRLVRYLHPQGALSGGRQEDHGLRDRGAIGMGGARRNRLPHRRWRRPDRHVEGL